MPSVKSKPAEIPSIREKIFTLRAEKKLGKPTNIVSGNTPAGQFDRETVGEINENCTVEIIWTHITYTIIFFIRNIVLRKESQKPCFQIRTTELQQKLSFCNIEMRIRRETDNINGRNRG